MQCKCVGGSIEPHTCTCTLHVGPVSDGMRLGPVYGENRDIFALGPNWAAVPGDPAACLLAQDARPTLYRAVLPLKNRTPFGVARAG